MSRKTKSERIRILNPLPGEAQFTTKDRAATLVLQGIAEFREYSELRKTGLYFTHSLRNFRRESKTRDDFWASQRECIPWSGDTGNSQLLFVPGEIRS